MAFRADLITHIDKACGGPTREKQSIKGDGLFKFDYNTSMDVGIDYRTIVVINARGYNTARRDESKADREMLLQGSN
jgi:hypothetical protein